MIRKRLGWPISLGGLLLIGWLGGLKAGAQPVSAPAARSGSSTVEFPLMNESNRVIRCGDVLRTTLRLPGRTLGSLEVVQKDGNVVTAEGSFVEAADLTLAAFRKNLAAMYGEVSTYTNAQVEAYIYSSPYRVVRYAPDPPRQPRKDVAHDASGNTNLVSKADLARPVIFSRVFKTPITVWLAIQFEGGIPPKVNPARIRILKFDLRRKTLNCGGAEGTPDGNEPVESGDCIFLIPGDDPAAQIFE